MPIAASANNAISGTRDRVMPRAPASFIVDSLFETSTYVSELISSLWLKIRVESYACVDGV
jgi:hypothetical protein